jgi:hypothetical protein
MSAYTTAALSRPANQAMHQAMVARFGGVELMSGNFTESVVEEAALEWFGALGYRVMFGPTIAPGEPAAERASYEQILLDGRLHDALRRLNPAVPAEAVDEAFRKLTRISSPQLVDANHELHYYLLDVIDHQWAYAMREPHQERSRNIELARYRLEARRRGHGIETVLDSAQIGAGYAQSACQIAKAEP